VLYITKEASMAKKDSWTVAGMKRFIQNNSPEPATPEGVDEAAVVALIQANPNHVVIGPQDPIPPNTPSGRLILRTT
jgi:hypothetical protein